MAKLRTTGTHTPSGVKPRNRENVSRPNRERSNSRKEDEITQGAISQNVQLPPKTDMQLAEELYNEHPTDFLSSSATPIKENSLIEDLQQTTENNISVERLTRLLHRWVDLVLLSALERSRTEGFSSLVAFTHLEEGSFLPAMFPRWYFARETGETEQAATDLLSALKKTAEQATGPWEPLGWILPSPHTVPGETRRWFVLLWDHYFPFVRHAEAWQTGTNAVLLSREGNQFEIAISRPGKEPWQRKHEHKSYLASDFEVELLRDQDNAQYFVENGKEHLLPKTLVFPYAEERRQIAIDNDSESMILQPLSTG